VTVPALVTVPAFKVITQNPLVITV